MAAIDEDGTVMRKEYILEVLADQPLRITLKDTIRSAPLFKKLFLDDQFVGHAKCTKCKTVYICKYTRATGNRTMKHHMKQFHPDDIPEEYSYDNNGHYEEGVVYRKPPGKRNEYKAKSQEEINAAMEAFNSKIYSHINAKARACFTNTGFKTRALSELWSCNFCDYVQKM